jgi:hypothetical protein
VYFDYDRDMKILWDWLKTAIENRPITFVALGGITTYALTVFVALILFTAVRHTSIVIIPFLSAFIVVGFHWFVARYERKSTVAQILSIIPAGFFAFLCLLAAYSVVDSQICWKNPDSNELECKIP